MSGGCLLNKTLSYQVGYGQVARLGWVTRGQVKQSRMCNVQINMDRLEKVRASQDGSCHVGSGMEEQN